MLSFNDLSSAVSHLCKVQPCSKSDCECCSAIRELLAKQNVVEYISSDIFKAQKLPVQIAMCDNFQGFSNFCCAEFGMDPILCKPHATGKTLVYLCVPAEFLIPWPAGIAASQYYHVKHFPNQDAYNEYYDYLVDICDIGVESFATRAQTILVDHLRQHYRDEIANWCLTFGVRHVDECLLPIVGMLDATTTWELKCHDASRRDIKKLLPLFCLSQLRYIIHYVTGYYLFTY
jgi:hypothetical protein